MMSYPPEHSGVPYTKAVLSVALDASTAPPLSVMHTSLGGDRSKVSVPVSARLYASDPLAAEANPLGTASSATVQPTAAAALPTEWILFMSDQRPTRVAVAT